MTNSPMKKTTLYLHGGRLGKTVKLADIQFTEGKVVLYGVSKEVDSLAKYLGRCYQAWPMEEKENGASEIQETGRGNVSAEIRAEERPSTEIPTNDGAGPDPANMDECRGVSSGSGYEDSRLSSPEERFSNSSTAKVDPEKLLEAMDKLDQNDEDQWRRDGLPKVDAVAKLYGSEGLTRKDLTAVWPELTKTLKK